jgi:preprotein translocase subunit YajC
MLSLLFPLVLLGVMYFFLIVPQRKRQRAHEELLRNVGVGDEVLTTGGIYGGVTEVDGDTLFLEIAPDVEIKVSRRAIAERVYASGSSSPAVGPAPDDDAESSAS